MYVLIIMSWMGGAYGYSFSSIEFNSEQSCEVAKFEVTKLYDATNSRFKATCVKK